MTYELTEAAEVRLLDAAVEEGGTTTCEPSLNEVVNGSSDLVRVSTSPLD